MLEKQVLVCMRRWKPGPCSAAPPPEKIAALTVVAVGDLAQHGGGLAHARALEAILLQARPRQLAERGQLRVRELPQH